jgi:hypothetical protein
MPISSSSKACRGDTVFFGVADVVEVAIMGGPAEFYFSIPAFSHIISTKQYHETKNMQFFAYFPDL